VALAEALEKPQFAGEAFYLSVGTREWGRTFGRVRRHSRVQHSDFAFSLQPRPPEFTDRRALFQALQPVEISTGYHVVGLIYLL
jgi:hypothetical protein